MFLLVRFTGQPELAKSVLALEFLQSMANKSEQVAHLQEVGDKALLFAGLFPEQADRKRVRISYFVELGQTAYSTLSDVSKRQLAELYQELGKSFVKLMDVLHSTRELAGKTLTLIQAESLWNDVGSEHALAVLSRYAHGMPIRMKPFVDTKH